MINPALRWLTPQTLKGNPYEPDLDAIPTRPGVYVFFRSHGLKREVLYVGKALNLRLRVKQQANNLKLMNGIRDASNGSRLLACGVVKLKPGQTAAAAIKAAEQMLIRHYVDEGHQLLNIQGTKISLQTLENDRPAELNKLIPKTIRAEG